MKMKLVSQKDCEQIMNLCGAYKAGNQYYRNISNWRLETVVGEYKQDQWEVPNYLYEAYIKPGYAVKSTLETLQSYSLWDRLCWSIKRIWEV